ncbi:hypothetical protein HBH98_248910 [Parastagonospora nodorum]|nr:hypothetical protein HBH53_253270 [Parastagonospora nodorum]KAH3956146.1 hypothetical protein HBH51_251380 [Parastagonospora nodorum]KAH4215387.1 hypothetical protein HBI06_254080 [Parastagonospora nodorum]KAH4223073.1 hypothetical protein HBI05_249590 [Parastagonospora nodorum]KAH4333472.1 hypothetical protein HBH98_248910 [Parastagonospora nodorum]
MVILLGYCQLFANLFSLTIAVSSEIGASPTFPPFVSHKSDKIYREQPEIRSGFYAIVIIREFCLDPRAIVHDISQNSKGELF